MAENSYSYTGKDGSCRYDNRGTGIKASSYKMATAQNIDAIKSALNQQPVSVLVEADRSAFQSYRSGILDSTSCGTNLDHAVGMVGYGTSGGVGYWIMRNSWGSTWGDKGYMKLKIVSGAGICGIQQSVYSVFTN